MYHLALLLTIIFDLSPVGLLRWNITPSKSAKYIHNKYTHLHIYIFQTSILRCKSSYQE